MELQDFLTYLQRHKRSSENTITSYRNDLDALADYLESQYQLNLWSEVKHFHIRAFIVSLMKEGVTPKSINRKISAFRSFYRFLMRSGVVETNPMLKIVAPKIPKRLPEFITSSEMKKLFDSLDPGDDFTSSRNVLILSLLYHTGIRRAELINIKDYDIDKIRNLITVIGKGNKQRAIPINDKLLSLIESYCQYRTQIDRLSNHLLCTEKGKPLYPKLVYNIVHKHLSLIATQTKKSPHILRHTFATHMANNGAELNSIKELLGHANLSATQVYTHNSIQQLKKVYERAHPKSGK